jgi:hypothetical protein
MDPVGTHVLEDNGIQIVDGFEVAHLARIIKTPEEIDAVRQSVRLCQIALRKMIAATKAGMRGRVEIRWLNNAILDKIERPEPIKLNEIKRLPRSLQKSIAELSERTHSKTWEPHSCSSAEVLFCAPREKLVQMWVT